MAEMTSFAYDLHPVVTPVLRGWLLAVFTWLLHTPLGGLILALLRRKAGVASFRRLDIAAPVTLAPVWPAPTQRDLGDAFTCRQLSGLEPRARANFAAGAAQNDSSVNPQRLQSQLLRPRPPNNRAWQCRSHQRQGPEPRCAPYRSL